MKAIEVLHKKLIQSLGSIKDKTILDYGCGRGGIVKLLLEQSTPPAYIYAVDCDVSAIKNIEIVYADAITQCTLGTRVVSNPSELLDQAEQLHKKIDVILCHNVLECIENKERFIQDLYALLKPNGTLLISHHDFDSAVYNSDYRDLTRELVHYFSDTGEAWQTVCDGQIGRKMPGIFKRAGIENAAFETWRMVETTFNEDDYSHLMANMMLEVARKKFEQGLLDAWMKDLELKAENHDFYFAIDVVVVKACK
jgi:ubiquinone/menaquinone biosynthesis C-methylase UbiE